jgi:hypothetical protein
MLSRSDEEEMNAPEDVDPSAAMTRTDNGGAGRVKPDSENFTENESEDEMRMTKRLILLFGNSSGSTRRTGAQYWCNCFVVQFDTDADVWLVSK